MDLFYTANRLVPGSYVSGTSALAHHGLLRRMPAEVLSITPGRSKRVENDLGIFVYKKLKEPSPGTVVDGLATMERALFDHIRLTPGSQRPGYLRQELGLCHAEKLDRDFLLRLLQSRTLSPKLRAATAWALLYSRGEVQRLSLSKSGEPR